MPVTISTTDFDAVLFDLDGVVTQTEKLHTIAWKALFDEFLSRFAQRNGTPFVPFDAETDYLQYVDGKQRYDGVTSFLAARDIPLPYGDPEDDSSRETVCGLGNKKNSTFLACLAEKGVEAFESTIVLIKALRQKGLKIAIVSSSKNCKIVLEQAGLTDLFDTRVDGVESATYKLPGKPAPDTYLEAARRLAVRPERAAIVEDANSGVEAGHRGGFGLVLGVARQDNQAALEQHGADAVVTDLKDVRIDDNPEQPRIRNALNLPSALSHLPLHSLQEKRPVVFLDYDGTLTPIVSRPELATLAPDMRHTLAVLAERCPVAVVSGRDRADIQTLVQLDSVYYAGSHGFDIAGPHQVRMQHAEGLEFLPLLDEVETQLQHQLGTIQGALVERKKFTIAVHFRNVASEQVGYIESLVDAELKKHPQLRKGLGKKVFELQPRLDWHKGKAVLWLLDTLALHTPDVVLIYIGDDITDEDAFHTLAGYGLTIVVADTPRRTAARYALQNPAQVQTLLQRLAASLSI
ncbi:MAG: trehalose-phosphatase [Desulfurellaceae bacterium]|nr:trehalose-phosphatase [Desulfurellaceae bacterium]